MINQNYLTNIRLIIKFDIKQINKLLEIKGIKSTINFNKYFILCKTFQIQELNIDRWTHK